MCDKSLLQFCRKKFFCKQHVLFERLDTAVLPYTNNRPHFFKKIVTS